MTAKPKAVPVMVERIAKAIRTYGIRIWGAPHLYAVISGEKLDDPIMRGLSCERAHQEAAKLNARAAIEAIMEPTDEMLAAADSAIPRFEEEFDGSRVMGVDGALDCWRAMCEEMLRSEGEGPASEIIEGAQ